MFLPQIQLSNKLQFNIFLMRAFYFGQSFSGWKIFFTLILFPLVFFSLAIPVPAQEKADILITNGKIFDGTGNSWYYADILVKEGKIYKIGKFDAGAATKTIDANGLTVAPGFIDVHTHIEGEELKTPRAENFIYDGVTSVVTGNCGASNIDLAKYFRFIDSIHLSINVASLIGHNDVRKEVMGRANRMATAAELNKMERIVERAMQDGAVGFSTGLIYIPGTYAPSDEVIALARVASRYQGLYATHMRNEGDSVVQAIQEALRIGREAKIPVEVSHFKVSGQQNWKRSSEIIAMIYAGRQEGIEVTIDQYPYTASSTSLSTLLPDDVLADGQDSIVSRLQNPVIVKAVTLEMLRSLKRRKLKHFSYAVVAYYKADTSYNGKSIEQINRLNGRKHTAKAEVQTILDMMLQGGAQMIFHGMSDWDVKNIMRCPFSMFASDASIREFGRGAPHPRGYGTNARVLAKYVREENVITLEEAIRRMTSLPAQKFHFSDRGLLKEGFAADIVIFDPQRVKDNSTFEKPHAYSGGFKYVLVNGMVTLANGMHIGTRSGKVLYGPGYHN